MRCTMLQVSLAFRGSLIASAVALLLAAPPTQAQTAAKPAAPGSGFDANAVIPFDAAVRTGTLPNGLTFFIRTNAQPAKRVALRLAVKAGSLDEADDQQGLAHFLEHMAFNGSEHFKPGELVSYFESMGARLGPHVNAYTSFDETVYMLDLPSDSFDVVSRGLTAFADFAGGMTLDPEQVDKERGVVIEEWRGRLGANSRVRDRQIPVLYRGSRYAERLPIGKPEVIRTAPVARLRAFYDAWYRPERMALVVVGDVDAAQAEAAVRATFGALKSRGPAQPRVDAGMPLNKELLANVTADPEITASSVQVVRKRPREPFKTAGDYRRLLVVGLLERMFNDRFNELSRKADAKFLSAGGGDGAFTPAVNAFTLGARVQDGQLLEGLSALEIETRRVLEHGFAASELERAKASTLASYERAYSERDKNESGRYAQEYLSYFLTDEPSPGIAYEYQLAKTVLPAITLDEISEAARVRLSAASRVVLAVAPEKSGLMTPSEGELTATLAAAAKVAVMPWTDTTSTRALLEQKPERAAVVERRELGAIGVTVVRFANGVEAWLKPTDFKNDQVMFTMYAPGGASLAPPEAFTEASLATALVNLSGVGGFSARDLEKALAGKRASASPFISLSTHGISGTAAPSELELALQLLYVTTTAPGNDPDSFALLKRQLTAAVANRGQNPGQVFGERLELTNTSNHYTSKPLTEAEITMLDRDRMLAYYRARFANAADFTLFMVGAFQKDTAIDLLARYVGSLPSTGKRTSEVKDLGIHFPSAVQKVVVEKGREPRGQAVLSYFADAAPDPMEQERIVAATTVLETALRDVLREDLGQTYNVSVGLAQSLPQRGDGHIQVSFAAAPENLPSLVDRVMQEITRLREKGPTAEAVASAKESALRGYEVSLSQNPYWLRRLQTVHMLGGNPTEIVTRRERIDALTPASIREAFVKYFPADRYTVVTLVPAPSTGQQQ
jgi:zinc protease